MKKRIAEARIWAKENRTDYTMVKTACSLAFNLSYAMFNLILAVFSSSLWYLSVSAFLALLGAMRLHAVISWRKERRKKSLMRFTGIMMLLLSIALFFIVLETSMRVYRSVKYGEIVMISIATYTFIKISLAVMKAVKERNDHDPLSVSVRHIIYAETAISIVNMQRSMIITFGNEAEGWEVMMNSMTGTAAFIFTAFLGVSLLRKVK